LRGFEVVVIYLSKPASRSKATFDVAFRTPKRIIHKVFRNETSGFEQLAKFLRSKKVEKAHACLEATGTYAYELSLFLLEKRHLVTQVNPLRIKGHKQSLSIHGKTDKLDAIVILDYAERFRDNLRLWEPPPPKMQRLRALLTRREQLIVMEQMESNRLKVSISSGEEHRSVERLYSFL
jgi:transposase